jgi:hypothetical protein
MLVVTIRNLKRCVEQVVKGRGIIADVELRIDLLVICGREVGTLLIERVDTVPSPQIVAYFRSLFVERTDSATLVTH